MTNFESLIALNMIPGIGSVRLKKLLDFFGSPENIFKVSKNDLTYICGLEEKIVDGIIKFDKRALEKEFTLIKKFAVDVITIEDSSYPKNLKEIPGAPSVLYLKGKLLIQEDSLAVVGSRSASLYGLLNAEKFSAELSKFGFTIVSGLAYGVDTYAHQGALKQNARTIAVLGSGLANIYPAENYELAQKVSHSGAVISEFPMATSPIRQNFPRRNRIISGLSLGVLVVEAAKNSGALITADFALEQGREVFALPGRIGQGNSFGTNELIKQGAKLVTCVEDIIEEFELVRPERHKEIYPADSQSDYFAEYGNLGQIFSSGAVYFDEIKEAIGLGVQETSGIILELKLKNMIKELPGKLYVRSV